jgi:dihydropteroate synthase
LSIDTYHFETIQKVVAFYLDEGLHQDLVWNDISGKFDIDVYDFLKISQKFSYVFCHNLAPSRALSGSHMSFVDPDLSLAALKDYFLPFKHPQVIFDPCLGFSKSFEQNWMILENFNLLQEMIGHSRWLLGFSRKSFLRKRFGIDLSDKDRLDEIHTEVLRTLKLSGEVWIRSHRPELI